MEVHCYICHSPLVVMVCAICVSSMCVSSLFIPESHQMLKHPTELWLDHVAVLQDRQCRDASKILVSIQCQIKTDKKENVCCVITALSISYIYRQVISLNSLNILLHVYYQYVHVWICMDSTVFHITPLPLMINCKPSWGFLHPSKIHQLEFEILHSCRFLPEQSNDKATRPGWTS